MEFDVKDMAGLTFSSVEKTTDNDELIFTCTNGDVYDKSKKKTPLL